MESANLKRIYSRSSKIPKRHASLYFENNELNKLQEQFLNQDGAKISGITDMHLKIETEYKKKSIQINLADFSKKYTLMDRDKTLPQTPEFSKRSSIASLNSSNGLSSAGSDSRTFDYRNANAFEAMDMLIEDLLES